MLITSLKIRQKFLLLIILLFNFNSAYAQDINGVFLLSKNNENYYVHIENNSYDLFSLESNPAPEGKSMFVLKEVGNGHIKKEGKNLIFGFDSIFQKHRFFSTDSLVSSMHTNQSKTNRMFEIIVKASIPDYNNTFLIIESNARSYYFQVRNGSAEIEFPDSIVIKRVYLSIMGYGKRQLPYIGSFNLFKYAYFLNDMLPQIDYINNTVWTFPITSQNKAIYRFENSNYLSKMDEKSIAFLKRLANENDQIKEITKNWFEN